eukprot:jgi/Tetstr1/437021/TSEL_025781.t1
MHEEDKCPETLGDWESRFVIGLVKSRETTEDTLTVAVYEPFHADAKGKPLMPLWLYAQTKGGKKPVDTSREKCMTLPWKLVEAVPLSYAKAIHDASGSREVFNEDGTMARKKWPPSDDTERPSLRLGAGLAHSFRGAESGGEAVGAMAAATVSMHPAARPAFRSDRIRTEQRGPAVQSTIQTNPVKGPDHPPRLALAAPDRIPRARALVHTKKGLRALNICLIFGADAIERDVAEVAGVPAASLRVFPSEQAALEGSYAAPLNTFGDRLRKQGQRPPRENLQAAQYTFDGDTLVFHVAAPPVLGGGARRPRQRSTHQPSSAHSTGGSASRSRASPAQDSPTDYPSRDSEHAGVVVAPRWAVEHARGVFLANAPAVTDTADGGDEMSLDICRFVARRRREHLKALKEAVPDAPNGHPMLRQEASRFQAWTRGRYGRLWASGHKGEPAATQVLGESAPRPDKGDVGEHPPVIPAPKTAPTAARVVQVPVPTRSTAPPRPPFDELELVAANVAHAKAAKDKAAAKKRHDIEDDEDNDDQDSDEDLGLASLVGAQAAATNASWPAGKGKGARGKKRGRGGQ